MLRWFFHRKLNAEEKRLGESMGYLRQIVDTSPAAFLRFASILPFANSRKTLPKEAWYAAQIITLQHEDCGPCLQIAVNLAQEDGVPSSIIEAILNGDQTQLSDDLTDLLDFTDAIVNSEVDPAEMRETLRSRYSERGLIELSYAIASSRVPPTVKRVLGFATSCRGVSTRPEEPDANSESDN